VDFVYRAVDPNGKEIRGDIKAENEVAASQQLKAEGLMPLEIKKATIMTKGIEISFGNLTSPRDLSVFSRQIVSMLNAGITILDALAMLGEQAENKHMKTAVEKIQTDIKKGETLSDAMRKHPKVFPSIMVSMVAAGEASGRLETAFERMAEHFEKDAKIRGMIKKSAMYPIVLIIVMIIVVIVMLVKVIPSYTVMFDEMDVEMPALTQMVINASDFIQAKWPVLLLIVVGIVIGFTAYGKSYSGRIVFGNIAIKMPVFGPLSIKTASSLFSRTLSTLLASGLSMNDAMAIVADTMQNQVYTEVIKEAREEIIKGVPLSEPLQKSKLFPPMVIHMIKIGEETGDIESMLDRLANYYDEEVEMATQSVMAALEPMITIVMAGVVVFLIGTIMAPMTSMYDGLDNL